MQTVASPPDLRQASPGGHLVESWQICNCGITVVDALGEILRVKGRKWDCPSCGRDKARKIRDMVVAAGADRMWTLTFTQPHYVDGLAPERHANCDPETHVYVYKDDTLRWRMLETCSHCCAWSARCIANFRKSLRRQWPSAQMIWVREIKPQSGAFDINLAIIGVPPATRRTRGGKRIKMIWAQSGGGHLDLGDNFKGCRSARGVGSYVGKYLTKFAHRRLAKGYRRWSRTAGFGSEVRMSSPPKPASEVREGGVGLLGWTDPLSGHLRPERWWPGADVEAVWVLPPAPPAFDPPAFTYPLDLLPY